MPTKGTQVIAVRVPVGVADAIRDEAASRGISVNELLNLRLAADFHRGHRVQNLTEKEHNSSGDGSIGNLIQDIKE